MNTKNTFENCDQFADYIIDSVLEFGDKVTLEFNRITNLDIPTGRSLEEWLIVNPQRGENFKKFGTVKAFLYDIYELTKSPLFQYYENARQAYYWCSMNPDKVARINLNEHIAELNQDLLEIPLEEHTWYTEKYVKLFLDWLSSKSRTASPMVTGPANFNTRRNEKALNAERNKYQTFSEWREKAKEGIRKRIERNKPAEQKNEESWNILKNHIIKQSAVIQGIDNGTEPYSRALFVSSLVNPIETAAKNGKTELVEKALNLIEEINKPLKKPIVTPRHKVWNLREIAFDKSKAKEFPNENEIYSIPNGQITVNYEADRIQIKHDEKPRKEIIDLLKKNSFNWSRFHGCWQRKITLNTKFAVKKMFDIDIK